MGFRPSWIRSIRWNIKFNPGEVEKEEEEEEEEEEEGEEEEEQEGKNEKGEDQKVTWTVYVLLTSFSAISLGHSSSITSR